MNDESFMRRALALAYNGTGKVSPNPRVGCVIASGSSIIGEGWHEKYGEAHAEINALRSLTTKPPSNATLYVTLEPCSHKGKTGPCTDAIISAGIKHVVIGITDPYHEVNGRGITQLRNHGIDVRVGILEEECRWANRFFIKHVTTSTPYMILKLAQSIDGFIAPIEQKRVDMTGTETQRVVHALRNEVDAVLVGIETVLADDPLLSVREVKGRNPARIIMDSHCRTPINSRIMQTARDVQTLIVAAHGAPAERIEQLTALGAEVHTYDSPFGIWHSPIGISSILCEGGPTLARTLLEEDLVDEFRVHTAATTLHTGRRLENVNMKRQPVLHNILKSGTDVLATYVMKVLAVMFTAALSVSFAQAQPAMSKKSLHLLDTALSIMGMTRTDCAMPPDLLDRDKQRTPFHDSLFTNPFGAADVAAVYARIKTSDNTSVQSIVQRAMSDMSLGTYQNVDVSKLEGSLPASSLLGVDLHNHIKPAAYKFFERFVVPMLQTHAQLTGMQRTWRNQTLVYTQCDSLWMNSEGSDDLNLWDSYKEEQRARQIAETFFGIADPQQVQNAFVYGSSLYALYLNIVNETSSFVERGRDSVKTVIIETNLGRIALGGPGNDVYSGHFALIIDVGGNDLYICSTFDSLAQKKLETASTPAACIIDYSGNDSYVGTDYSFGSGVGGVGILIDVSGNDTYTAGDFSLGCGLFGFGVMNDMSGDDSYTSGQNTQGAGIFGIGIQCDGAGNDVYRSHAQAQGFGATRGVGVLVDNSGNDHYIAASPFVDALRYESHFTTFTQGAALGFRPCAAGGVGVLADLDGNDNYTTDIYGQGTGYWFGLGALIDRKGEDRYSAYQYAQGAGIHFATGLLLDSAGSDVYVSHGVSQGCGHDIGVGALVDEGGNDIYVVESLSLGGGNANAVSVFVDATGDDSYSARDTTNTMGYSDFRRWYGMVGVFADGGGNDMYSTSKGNNTVKVKSSYGVFLDTRGEKETTTESTPPSYVQMPLSSTPDQLFIQASAAPLKYQNNVVPARDSLARMGLNVLPFLETYLGTTMPRERLTLEHVFPIIYTKYPTDVDSVLIRGLNSEKIDVVAQSATVAGKVKSKATIPYLDKMLTDVSWRKRRIAALTVGQIADSSTLPNSTTLHTLTSCLSDDESYVRARAAYTIGELGGKEALTTLRRTLNDRSAIVRYSAVEGLNRGTRRTVFELKQVWTRMLRYTHGSSLRLVASCDTTEANAKEFALYYQQTRADIRAEIDRILPSVSNFWQRALIARPKKTKLKS